MKVRSGTTLNRIANRRKYTKRPDIGRREEKLIKSSYIHTKIINSEILNKMSPLMRAFYMLNKKMGEVQTTLVNAIGTALIAPVFITYNPISKKDDKETRVYSAWRQPVSAVLSVATSLGINIPFQKYINNLASNGKLGENYDLSIKPSSAYILKPERKKGRKLKGNEVIDFVDAIRSQKFEQAVAEETKKIAARYKNPENAARVARQTITTHLKKMEGNVKGLKTICGLALSILTLPPTCGLLNWAYPRFMELVFPKMCKAIKMKEANTI